MVPPTYEGEDKHTFINEDFLFDFDVKLGDRDTESFNDMNISVKRLTNVLVRC